MRKSVGKLFGYMAAILLAFLIDKLVPNLWIIPHRLMAAYLCVCELISILENLAIITQAKAFVSLIKLIRGKNDENVIYDLINEKNADYSARSPFGRVQSKPQTAIFADGGDRYGDRDRTGPGYGGGPRTRPVVFNIHVFSFLTVCGFYRPRTGSATRLKPVRYASRSAARYSGD